MTKLMVALMFTLLSATSAFAGCLWPGYTQLTPAQWVMPAGYWLVGPWGSADGDRYQITNGTTTYDLDAVNLCYKEVPTAQWPWANWPANWSVARDMAIAHSTYEWLVMADGIAKTWLYNNWHGHAYQLAMPVPGVLGLAFLPDNFFSTTDPVIASTQLAFLAEPPYDQHVPWSVGKPYIHLDTSPEQIIFGSRNRQPISPGLSTPSTQVEVSMMEMRAVGSQAFARIVHIWATMAKDLNEGRAVTYPSVDVMRDYDLFFDAYEAAKKAYSTATPAQKLWASVREPMDMLNSMRSKFVEVMPAIARMAATQVSIPTPTWRADFGTWYTLIQQADFLAAAKEAVQEKMGRPMYQSEIAATQHALRTGDTSSVSGVTNPIIPGGAPVASSIIDRVTRMQFFVPSWEHNPAYQLALVIDGLNRMETLLRMQKSSGRILMIGINPMSSR